ncbi:hypothetical protein NADFUDRAFT_43369 [Nadsonia fulvescens var. elongata DSM 6958]|uniref:Uncharacterized protein n=1 Tax=Nadsonia fulvescens var. elongata DSM 6958 TaxID=857566 RepID=A0A1E3PHM8_9ASCO|nr:hypothetical protein NADFUDRAFT_43369 [Nadsonia fulvescens var. elongata DSM 6958]
MSFTDAIRRSCNRSTTKGQLATRAPENNNIISSKVDTLDVIRHENQVHFGHGFYYKRQKRSVAIPSKCHKKNCILNHNGFETTKAVTTETAKEFIHDKTDTNRPAKKPALEVEIEMQTFIVDEENSFEWEDCDSDSSNTYTFEEDATESLFQGGSDIGISNSINRQEVERLSNDTPDFNNVSIPMNNDTISNKTPSLFLNNDAEAEFQSIMDEIWDTMSPIMEEAQRLKKTRAAMQNTIDNNLKAKYIAKKQTLIHKEYEDKLRYFANRERRRQLEEANDKKNSRKSESKLPSSSKMERFRNYCHMLIEMFYNLVHVRSL